jgi:hypothetical protein
MTPDDRRFEQHKMHALISPEREARWDPPGFLSKLLIQPGQSVLDLGSGPAFGHCRWPEWLAWVALFGRWMSARKCWIY